MFEAPDRLSAVPSRAVGGDVRRNNLEVILRHLDAAGTASRASIAGATGLTRATVSRLVAELVGAGLVREGERSAGGRAGRPSTELRLDGRHVLALGTEVNVDYLALLTLDFAGNEVDRAEQAFDARGAGPDATVSALAQLCRDGLERLGERRGDRPVVLAGIGVAVPALVEVSTGVVTEAPNLHWRGVPLGEALRHALGGDVPVRVGNDANLSAIAEYRAGEWAGVPDLISITGEVGIGGGIIVGGRPLLGRHGHGGEVGHMTVDRDGRPCGCGRRGCWEASIGLAAVLDAAGLAPMPSATPRQQVDALVERARAGDRTILAVLDTLGTSIGVGAANLANLVDPQVIVLGGYFTQLGEWVLPSARDALARGILAPVADAPVLTTSRLGFTAAAQGAATDAMGRVLSDPLPLLGAAATEG